MNQPFMRLIELHTIRLFVLVRRSKTEFLRETKILDVRSGEKADVLDANLITKNINIMFHETEYIYDTVPYDSESNGHWS